jgi:hypothetical protein
MIKMPCDVLTDFLVEPFSFMIVYVDANIARQWEGENNIPQIPGYKVWDKESILPIVISNSDMTILSIVNAAIAYLPYPSWINREL